MAAELVLIRGLPGSGKSTMAKVLALVGYRHLETDQFFTGDDGVYRFDRDQLSEAHDWCRFEAMESLEEDRRVVVANTFTTLAEMQPYIDFAHSLDAEVTVVTAAGQWTNTHNVPDEAMQRMRARWEEIETF